MPLVRFEEIRRYIHTRCRLEEETSERVAEEDDAEVDLDEDRRVDAVWYGKLEPLARPIREKFKRYIELRTEVSIDEMMVRCTGRTQHTTKVKNKPIPQGYKVFALCCEGYLYDWIYWSTTAKMGDVSPVPGFCDTSSIVIRLAKSLPYNRYPFIIFMDNFFSSVDLFA